MMKIKHTRFVTGVPIWSEFKNHPVLYCKTHKVYEENKWLYLKYLVIWELMNWDNYLIRAYRFFAYRLARFLYGEGWVNCPYCGKYMGRKINDISKFQLK